MSQRDTSCKWPCDLNVLTLVLTKWRGNRGTRHDSSMFRYNHAKVSAKMECRTDALVADVIRDLPQCRHAAISKWRLLARGSDHVTKRSANFEIKNPCWGAVTYLFEDNCSRSLAPSPSCSVAILNCSSCLIIIFYWEVGERFEYLAWRTNTLAKVFAWKDDGKVHEEKSHNSLFKVIYSKCFIL